MDIYNPLKLISTSDPLLHNPVPDFDFVNPVYDPIALYNAVGSFMMEKNGLGLSCNQVGLSARMFTLRGKEILPFFNPVIVWASEGTTVAKEGCLSYPFLFVNIKRPANIRVRFADPNGKVQTQAFSGITARCIQHELDHLNGIVFVDRAGKFSLQMAKERAAKLAKKVGHLPQITYSM